jgi:dihydrolipoamide dehydrogenase
MRPPRTVAGGRAVQFLLGAPPQLNRLLGDIADGKYGELLGGRLIGHDVSELLPELTLAQKGDLTANELARNVHTHPTLSEALQECFHGLAGHMINF